MTPQSDSDAGPEVEPDPLAGWRMGRQPIREWIATASPEELAPRLVRALDRYGQKHPFTVALNDRLDLDLDRLFAEHRPRKAARLAETCRARGEHPHADRLQAALIDLMHCANCGRPLVDPVSIDRGIGPDCWEKIAPSWRAAIERRVTATHQ